MNVREVVIDAPLKGEWAILNPPGHPGMAFDFLATRGRKFPYPASLFPKHLLLSISVTDTYAWKQPVFAPAEGTVVECSDGAPDRERISMLRDLFRLLLSRPPAGSPFSAYGGNYVILECGNVYPLFAHLRCGSVCVKPGEQVKSGDRLGEVGNSGSSIQPHLHFQVMTNADPFPLFENLLPFRLRRVHRKIKNTWRQIDNAELANGYHLKF